MFLCKKSGRVNRRNGQKFEECKTQRTNYTVQCRDNVGGLDKLESTE